MQSLIIPALATVASSVAAFAVGAMWHRLTKETENGTITVTRKGTNKSVSLPKKYSHAAVRELAELIA